MRSTLKAEYDPDMRTVEVRYEGGPNDRLDVEIRSVAVAMGASDLGSGCLMRTPYTRELMLGYFEPEKAKEFIYVVLNILIEPPVMN